MKNIETRVSRLEQQFANEAISRLAPPRTAEMDAAFFEKFEALMSQPTPEKSQEEVIADFKASLMRMRVSRN